MKRRPTLKSLRAGQTLFMVDISATYLQGQPVVMAFAVNNHLLTDLRRLGDKILEDDYLSRRQAISAGRRHLQVFRARQRDRAALRAAFPGLSR